MCYEKRIFEIEIHENKKLLSSFVGKSTEKPKQFLERGDTKIISLTGSNNVEQFFKDRNTKRIAKLKKINTIYERFVQIYNRRKGLKIYNAEVNRAFPFFAGYVGEKTFSVNGKDFKCKLIINFHPVTANKTMIFFADLNDKLNGEILSRFGYEDFMSFCAQIFLVSMSWITNNSYWNQFSPDTKEIILRTTEFHKINL